MQPGIQNTEEQKNQADHLEGSHLLDAGAGIDTCGWAVRANNGPIVSSLREATLSEDLGIRRLPTMLFGDSFVSFMHQASGFTLSFHAAEALRGVGPADPNLQVRAAKVWLERKCSDDLPTLENPTDWTFTTRYPGSAELPRGTPAVFLKEPPPIPIQTMSSDVHPRSTQKPAPFAQIDYPFLRRIDVPILYYQDVLLFEDELDDNGIAAYRVRLRVMPSCFFILARFFLRVDGVLLRVHDTRYYHEFGSNVIVRHRTNKELEYDQATKLLTPPNLRDSDAVAEVLPEICSCVENLQLPTVTSAP